MVTDQFKAKDDAGNVYQVVVHRNSINTSTLNGPGSLAGLPDFRLSDGRSLNRLSQDVFQIVQTGTKITRV
ncbi:hypothetical protein J2794_003569 [Paraburkholderia terricola]|uniref:hypothetical protein n=1 Tax=Paraburkholderia terricola TaxID=169427 RepID=UPI002856DAE8|nr:hypothetical protein [Paraburkholderia terricola]MDR6447453.1 hypothetical protein [Paraburkholderia terricola]